MLLLSLKITFTISVKLGLMIRLELSLSFRGSKLAAGIIWVKSSRLKVAVLAGEWVFENI